MSVGTIFISCGLALHGRCAAGRAGFSVGCCVACRSGQYLFRVAWHCMAGVQQAGRGSQLVAVWHVGRDNIYFVWLGTAWQVCSRQGGVLSWLLCGMSVGTIFISCGLALHGR